MRMQAVKEKCLHALPRHAFERSRYFWFLFKYLLRYLPEVHFHFRLPSTLLGKLLVHVRTFCIRAHPNNVLISPIVSWARLGLFDCQAS